PAGSPSARSRCRWSRRPPRRRYRSRRPPESAGCGSGRPRYPPETAQAHRRPDAAVGPSTGTSGARRGAWYGGESSRERRHSHRFAMLPFGSFFEELDFGEEPPPPQQKRGPRIPGRGGGGGGDDYDDPEDDGPRRGGLGGGGLEVRRLALVAVAIVVVLV